MPDLVSYQQLKAHLQLPDDANQTAIEDLLENVEASLEAECDREALPFRATQTALVEVRDGTGTPRLWLDYPIAALTKITLGRDTASPDDTLIVTDVDVVSFSVGGRRLWRTDGGRFGAHRSPRYVHVTYDTQAFLPKLAKQAVLQVAGGYVRQFGAEGFKSFRLLDSAGTLAELMKTTPEWSRAVERYRRIVLV